MKCNKSKTKQQKGYEDLYICLHNADQKRQDLLHGIKNSLIMQGEYEKILELRKLKIQNLTNIKNLLNQTNKKYQELRKELPNVKNIISYTEKELSELEDQINMLRSDSKKVTEDIIVDTKVKSNMKKSNEGFREELARVKANRTANPTPMPKLKSKKSTNVKKSTPHKKLSRLDRIKNNLNVIQTKLKDI